MIGIEQFSSETAAVEVDFAGGAEVEIDLHGGAVIATEGEAGLAATSVELQPYSDFASAYVANAESLPVAAGAYTPVADVVTHLGLGRCKAVIGAAESRVIVLYVVKV